MKTIETLAYQAVLSVVVLSEGLPRLELHQVHLEGLSAEGL